MSRRDYPQQWKLKSMRRNISEFVAFVRDAKQKNLSIKILLIGFSELLLPTWLASYFVQETQAQRAILRAAIFFGFSLMGFGWIIMAIRKEFIQIITIRGTLAILIGAALGISSWIVAIIFLFIP